MLPHYIALILLTCIRSHNIYLSMIPRAPSAGISKLTDDPAHSVDSFADFSLAAYGSIGIGTPAQQINVILVNKCTKY